VFDVRRSKKFLRQYGFCQSNATLAAKIDELVVDTVEHPRSGIGRPKRLRHKIREMWSRRIDQGNRLVYTIIGNTIYFEGCIGHYDDH
jgi:toxin YoeB